MKIHELQLTPAKDRKRLGRGIGSGYGKTAGRGTKGQKARTGGSIRVGFEGGQNPLAKRLPKKRGFVALSHTSYQVVSLKSLNQAFKDNDAVNLETLTAQGLVKKDSLPIKILATGTLERKLKIRVQAASAAAKAAIEKAGGTLELVTLKFAGKKATRPGQGKDE